MSKCSLVGESFSGMLEEPSGMVIDVPDLLALVALSCSVERIRRTSDGYIEYSGRLGLAVAGSRGDYSRPGLMVTRSTSNRRRGDESGLGLVGTRSRGNTRLGLVMAP